MAVEKLLLLLELLIVRRKQWGKILLVDQPGGEGGDMMDSEDRISPGARRNRASPWRRRPHTAQSNKPLCLLPVCNFGGEGGIERRCERGGAQNSPEAQRRQTGATTTTNLSSVVRGGYLAWYSASSWFRRCTRESEVEPSWCELNVVDGAGCGQGCEVRQQDAGGAGQQLPCHPRTAADRFRSSIRLSPCRL